MFCSYLMFCKASNQSGQWFYIINVLVIYRLEICKMNIIEQFIFMYNDLKSI